MDTTLGYIYPDEASCLCSLNPTETSCTDGLDNDCDGDLDCLDSDCAGLPPETSCTDGLDNDCDGLTDYGDTDDCQLQEVQLSVSSTTKKKLIGQCTQDSDCLPCSLCVERGGTNQCVWACRWDVGCDTTNVNYPRGLCNIAVKERVGYKNVLSGPKDDSNILGSGLYSILKVKNAFDGSVFSAVKKQDSLTSGTTATLFSDVPISSCPSTSYSTTPTCIPEDYSTFWSPNGEGWYLYNISLTNAATYEDSSAFYRYEDFLGHYANFDENQALCTDYDYVWLNNMPGADKCPANVPGFCNFSNPSQCEIPNEKVYSVCADKQYCIKWCNTDSGTCWSDDDHEPLDPDMVPQFCTSPYLWSNYPPSGERCCGNDDSTTERTLTSNSGYICELDGTTWRWRASYDYTGMNYLVSDGVLISNNASWLKCGGAGATFADRTIETIFSIYPHNCIYCANTNGVGTNHSYYCIDGDLVECKGNDQWSTLQPAQGGIVKITGEFYGLAEADKKFCTPKGRWVSASDSDANSDSCEAIYGAGHWISDTLKCCGPGDYFSGAPTSTKACWNGQVILSGQPGNSSINPAYGKILNINGQLLGCDKTKEHDEIIVPLCNVSGTYYCSILSHNWTTPILESAPVLEAKYLPYPVDTIADACCVPEKCWNGSKCVDNQVSLQPPANGAAPYNFGGTLYRCSDGEWEEALLKYDWWPEGIEAFDEDKHIGYCLEPSQCLYNKGGDPFSGTFYGYGGGMFEGVCATSGSYDEFDNYCVNGAWTTRTKLVARKLLSFASSRASDYTLFCGRETGVCNQAGNCDDTGQYDFESILPHIDYGIPFETGDAWETFTGGDDVGGFFDYGLDPEDLVNGYCVLLYTEGGQQKAMFGASLNRDESGGIGFTDVFGRSPEYCKLDEYRAPECPSTSMCNLCNNGKFWFDNRTSLLFYTNEPLANGNILYTESQDLFNTFENEIKGQVDSWVLGEVNDDSDVGVYNDYSFAELTRRFDQVYIRKKGTQEIRAILEEAGTARPYFLVHYKGISVDACGLVNSYNNIIRDSETRQYFHCKGNQGDQWVLGGRDYDPIYPPYGVYPDNAVRYDSTSTIWNKIDIWSDLTLKFRLE